MTNVKGEYMIRDMDNSFKCSNCKIFVGDNEEMGTRWRNHCPSCLYSKHVDLETPGDRKASCNSRMEPIGLTLKKEGLNQYGEERRGELMLVHKCCNEECGKISINRLAGDDDVQAIMDVYENSLSLSEDLRKDFLSQNNITVLTESDRYEVESQLLGNGNESI